MTVCTVDLGGLPIIARLIDNGLNCRVCGFMACSAVIKVMLLDFREVTEAPVCATMTFAAHLRRMLSFVNAWFLNYVMAIVITSYSIHYTKLYDGSKFPATVL